MESQELTTNKVEPQANEPQIKGVLVYLVEVKLV